MLQVVAHKSVWSNSVSTFLKAAQFGKLRWITQNHPADSSTLDKTGVIKHWRLQLLCSAALRQTASLNLSFLNDSLSFWALVISSDSGVTYEPVSLCFRLQVRCRSGTTWGAWRSLLLSMWTSVTWPTGSLTASTCPALTGASPSRYRRTCTHLEGHGRIYQDKHVISR